MLITLLRKKLNVAVFMRQLAVMLAAGIPLARCFEILESAQDSNEIRTGMYKIRKMLLAGHTLSDSLAAEPQWFDTITLNIIRLGEQTGCLDIILNNLAAHQEYQDSLRRSIRQALFYPVILFITAMTLSTCMFIYVIPSFAELFKDIDKPLPLLTQSLFYISSVMRSLLPACLLPVFALPALSFTVRGKRMSASMRRHIIALPPINSILRAAELIQLIRNLSLALSSGITILDALKLSGSVCSNTEITSAARKLRASLSSGINLYQAMEPHTVFPVLLRQMVKSGEESGCLDKMLDKSANILEAQLQERIFHFIQLLEPLIMCVLGVLIGGLVIGLYLPVFNLGSAL